MMSRLELVRLMPMMGNAENVTRSMSVEAVAGRSLRICESRPSTYNSDCAMSTCQLKKTLICAEPRLVAERTVIAPGMSFIASSMGRVTVAIISSAGMMPLSTRMTTRGKLVCGNTDDGIRSADKTPARHSAIAMNVMDSACRVANRPKGEEVVEVIGNSFGTTQPSTRQRFGVRWPSTAFSPACASSKKAPEGWRSPKPHGDSDSLWKFVSWFHHLDFGCLRQTVCANRHD